ncbi:MAG: class I SAM-dependent methyltransferase [Candidatus Cloacimonadaceae bacterium]|nr:class I SAM-dependent methyltransferase [Candidatus Cloacimonadota bacterium]MDY0326592.1 class I SAM-dependent methyltransferase [Candidatus Cloacimonadaceae bacterium]
MANYDILGRYYDSFMNFGTMFSDFMDKLASHYHIETDAVLEIACGTGKNLSYFSRSKYIYGLDLSPVMLQSANINIPRAQLSLQDMSDFKIDRKFDLILCMFDSINHLLNYSQWLSTFKSVSDHLLQGGFFVFDINSPYALNLPINKRTMFRQSGDDYLVIQYYNSGINQATWDMNFFIHQDDGRHNHYFESITEVSFDVYQVRDNLLEIFSQVDVVNDKLESASMEDQRVFYICRKSGA